MKKYKIILFYVRSENTIPDSVFNKKVLGISQQICLLRKSALQLNPDFDLVILTTRETPHDGLDFDYDRIDCEIDTKCLMRERNRVQFEYIQKHADERIPFLMLDTDILLNTDPEALFSEEYDIGLTWRANDDMPINGGVVLVSNRNPDASKAFYRLLYENQIKDPEKLAHWFGEQRSMAKIIDLNPDQLAQTELLAKSGVQYRLFPCETHNHTPRHLPVFANKKILAPLIFHFKGSAARFMGQFWEYHLDRNSAKIPLRLIRLMGVRASLRCKRVCAKLFQ